MHFCLRIFCDIQKSGLKTGIQSKLSEKKKLKFGSKKIKAQKLLEKKAICVEFCLKHAHFTRKWLKSILMVSQEVCLEFFLKSINLKVSNKSRRSGGFETPLSHFYLRWCIDLNHWIILSASLLPCWKILKSSTWNVMTIDPINFLIWFSWVIWVKLENNSFQIFHQLHLKR